MSICSIGVILAVISVKTASKSQTNLPVPHFLMRILFIHLPTNEKSDADLKQAAGEDGRKEAEKKKVWLKVNSRMNVALGLVYGLILIIGLLVTLIRFIK